MKRSREVSGVSTHRGGWSIAAAVFAAASFVVAVLTYLHVQLLDLDPTGCQAVDVAALASADQQPGDLPSVSVQARRHGQASAGWTGGCIEVQPGEMVDVLIEYSNRSDKLQNDVTVKAYLPNSTAYVDGIARYANSLNPDGAPATDEIASIGLNVGNYEPTSNAFVTFAVRVAGADDLHCGTTPLSIVGRAETDSFGYEARVTLATVVEC